MSWLFLSDDANTRAVCTNNIGTLWSQQSNPRLRTKPDSDDDDNESESNSESESESGEDDEIDDTDNGGNENLLDDDDDDDEEEDAQQHETEEDLNQLTCVLLKLRLKAKGLPVSGRKAELINRLLTGKSSKKVKAWKKSDAKKLLTNLIYSNTPGVERMSTEGIYQSNEAFQDYSFEQFKRYLSTIRASAKKYNERAEISEREIWSDKMKFPRNSTTIRGYPHWDEHLSSILLTNDVKDGKANRMKPRELHASRKEYKEFPLGVFRDHIYQEKRRQREEAGWVFRRNNKGRKKHEAGINALSDDWNQIKYNKDYNDICEMMAGKNDEELVS